MEQTRRGNALVRVGRIAASCGKTHGPATRHSSDQLDGAACAVVDESGPSSGTRRGSCSSGAATRSWQRPGAVRPRWMPSSASRLKPCSWTSISATTTVSRSVARSRVPGRPCGSAAPRPPSYDECNDLVASNGARASLRRPGSSTLTLASSGRQPDPLRQPPGSSRVRFGDGGAQRSGFRTGPIRARWDSPVSHGSSHVPLRKGPCALPTRSSRRQEVHTGMAIDHTELEPFRCEADPTEPADTRCVRLAS